MADEKPTISLCEKITDLPPNKRYIATHDKDGKSIVHSSPPQMYYGQDGVIGMAHSCTYHYIPNREHHPVELCTSV
jgi:hypothetical protein